MTKNIVIISTYPEHGSRNIGDQLITDSLSKVIKENGDARINTVWRADSWKNVSDTILNATHVFFACLAIRADMEENIYPYLDKIIEHRIPFSVIAAGTDLPVHKNKSIYSGFSDRTKELLKRVNRQAKVFTTRGALSQEFCEQMGLDRATLNGDIAFYEKDFDNRIFSTTTPRKILISDPHRPVKYLPSLEVLYIGLSSLFPSAKIAIVQHGVSPEIEDFCNKKDIENIKIYDNKHDGLEVYEDADLHVGYRVHGHVSALKRRKYSYLLEQDGRGCDYGLTLNPKISIPNYSQPIPELTLKNAVKFVTGRPLNTGKVSVAPAEAVISLIRKDLAEGFTKFDGLEKQIMDFNSRSVESIRLALSKE